MTDREPHPPVAAATAARLPLAARIPAGAWDSHMHVVDPAAYALSPTAAYRPSTHTLAQALAFEDSVGIRNIVLVQPSIYGVDNACMLDALRRLGPQRGRAVVQFDPANTSLATLQEWHALGVRGVRLNIQSNGGEVDARQLSLLLHQYADAVRPLAWVVQVYVPMPLIALLEPIIPTLNVRFCIDHIGHPVLNDFTGSDPYQIPGFSSFVRLLQAGNTYLKLSAPYRFSQAPHYSGVEPIARELIRLFGTTRIVFATDWPHTRFEGLDIRPWIETVLEWCADDETLRERLFRGNAEDLWDVASA
ncbi:hypothetical protein AK830_g586 [Neonectria ditissima]|uniref:Amidohydrolase-related domain-containing protein n=1 Tax=Neonectria ditissima TaxID=78410 RepID=A0A0N8H8Z2_9HYPO|nr:hypothetical protein AK830_g586 [Neonectria ditissima]